MHPRRAAKVGVRRRFAAGRSYPRAGMGARFGIRRRGARSVRQRYPVDAGILHRLPGHTGRIHAFEAGVEHSDTASVGDDGYVAPGRTVRQPAQGNGHTACWWTSRRDSPPSKLARASTTLPFRMPVDSNGRLVDREPSADPNERSRSSRSTRDPSQPSSPPRSRPSPRPDGDHSSTRTRYPGPRAGLAARRIWRLPFRVSRDPCPSDPAPTPGCSSWSARASRARGPDVAMRYP